MTTLEDIASKLEDITTRLDPSALHLARIQNSSEVLQRDVRILTLDEKRVRPIAANAGDLILWHRALPHGSGINRTGLPRLAQYILCTPAGYEISPNHSADDPHASMYEKLRQQRIAQWERRIGPSGSPADPREAGPPADLTALGRKLLGLDAWE